MDLSNSSTSLFNVRVLEKQTSYGNFNPQLQKWRPFIQKKTHKLHYCCTSSVYLKNCSVSSYCSSSSGGEGPDIESVGSPKCSFSSKEMLSTLLAFLHRRDTDPCLRKNSFGSRPGPLFDTKIAEFILARCLRTIGFCSF